MDVTKNQTQVRAEIGWLWQREMDDDVQTDSGAVRFKTYKTDISEGRLEGVWHVTDKALNKDEAVEYELDYLTPSDNRRNARYRLSRRSRAAGCQSGTGKTGRSAK